MKISNYIRGQEVFFSRIVLLFINIKRLLFFSLLVSLISYLFLFFIYMPESFFSSQKDILNLINRISFKEIDSLRQITSAIFNLSLENIGLYSNQFKSIFIYSLIIFAAFLVMSSMIFSWRGKSLTKKNIKRGAKLIKSRVFKSEVLKILKQKKIPSEDFSVGLSFSEDKNIKIPSSFLTRHTSIIGQTGTGKSTVVRHFMDYIRKNNQKAIVVDINGELSALFKEKEDKVLSLFDDRSSSWDFSCETDISSSAFASFLCPEQGQANAFWWKGARSLVESLLDKEKDPQKLYDLIQDKGKIKECLSGYSRAIIGENSDSQAEGLIASAILDLGFLKYLGQQGGEPLSLSKWVNDGKANIIWLTVEDHNMTTVKPLLSLWVNIVILTLLRRDPDKNNMPLNLIVDELASFSKFELLTKGLERLRKYNGRILLSYQSDSQIEDLYGKLSAVSIRSNTGNKIIFRSTDPTDSSYLSKFLGSGEIDQILTSQSIGIKSTSDRENFSENEKYKAAVLESEIQSLKDFHFYFKTMSVDPVFGKIRNFKVEQKDTENHFISLKIDNNKELKEEEDLNLDFSIS